MKKLVYRNKYIVFRGVVLLLLLLSLHTTYYILHTSLAYAQTPEPQLTPTPTSPASAEETAAETSQPDMIRLSAIPPKIELSGKPGQTLQADLKVRNESATDLIITVESKDFVVFDDQGTPTPVNEQLSGRWALSQWLSLEPTRALLNPNQIRSVSLLVTIPPDALPGGHYAMVTYTPSTQANLAGSAAQIFQRVGALVSITVAGDIKEDMNVVKFEAKPELAEFGPINFETELLNLSDVHVKPQGTIVITSMFDRICTLLPLEELNIFPFVSRHYINTWNTRWGLGKYKAELKANYGSQGGLATAVIYFWIIPYRLIIAILLCLFFLFVAWWIKRQHHQSDSGFKNL